MTGPSAWMTRGNRLAMHITRRKVLAENAARPRKLQAG